MGNLFPFQHNLVYFCCYMSDNQKCKKVIQSIPSMIEVFIMIQCCIYHQVIIRFLQYYVVKLGNTLYIQVYGGQAVLLIIQKINDSILAQSLFFYAVSPLFYQQLVPCSKPPLDNCQLKRHKTSSGSCCLVMEPCSLNKPKFEP